MRIIIKNNILLLLPRRTVAQSAVVDATRRKHNDGLSQIGISAAAAVNVQCPA